MSRSTNPSSAKRGFTKPQPSRPSSTSRSSTGSAKSLRQQMSRDIQLQGKAQRTHDGYLREIRKLACYYNTSPDQLSQQQIGDYLLYLINEREFAPESLKVTYNAFKFFYNNTCPRDWDVLKKFRIPKQKTLPDVMTIDEVQQLIAATAKTPMGGSSVRLCEGSCNTPCPSDFNGFATTDSPVKTASSSLVGFRCWSGFIAGGVTCWPSRNNPKFP